MKNFNRCYGCMEPQVDDGICPKCQFDKTKYEVNPRCFRLGTLLHERYIIGRVIGEGGFGITYVGWDSVLDIPVAIKEYFPTSMGTRDTTTSTSLQINILTGKNQDAYQNGLEKYLKEAKTLSKFYNQQGIVSVRDFFKDNGTAYIIMEFIDGITLKEHMAEEKYKKMPPDVVFRIMKPVMLTLEKVHQEGIIHRDISPDNIMISRDGNIKLIDFGAAREAEAEENKSMTILLKKGFAPEEQYRSKGNQGAWTDVYAISATIYFMITGKVPPEATGRLVGEAIESFEELGIDIPKYQSEAILKGLGVMRRDRYDSIQQLYDALYNSYGDSQNIKQPESSLQYTAPPKPVVLPQHPNPPQPEGSSESFSSPYSATVLIDDEQSSALPEQTQSTVLLEEPVQISIPNSWIEEKKGKGKIIIILLLVFLVAGAGGSIFWFVGRSGESVAEKVVAEIPAERGMNEDHNKQSGGEKDEEMVAATATPAPSFTMINVVGKTVQEAKKEIQNMGDGNFELDISQEYSKKIKKGQVIRQSVEEGTIYQYGELKSVKLVVSKGEKLYKVPGVVGKLRDSAVRKLKKQKMKVKIKLVYNNSYAKGRVVKQSVKAGTKVKKGRKIKLIISLGKKPVSRPASTSAPASTPSPASTPAPTKNPDGAPIVSEPSSGNKDPIG